MQGENENTMDIMYEIYDILPDDRFLCSLDVSHCIMQDAVAMIVPIRSSTIVDANGKSASKSKAAPDSVKIMVEFAPDHFQQSRAVLNAQDDLKKALVAVTMAKQQREEELASVDLLRQSTTFAETNLESAEADLVLKQAELENAREKHPNKVKILHGQMQRNVTWRSQLDFQFQQDWVEMKDTINILHRFTEELVPFDKRHSKLIPTPYEDLKLPQGEWALNAMELRGEGYVYNRICDWIKANDAYLNKAKSTVSNDRFEILADKVEEL